MREMRQRLDRDTSMRLLPEVFAPADPQHSAEFSDAQRIAALGKAHRDVLVALRLLRMRRVRSQKHMFVALRLLRMRRARLERALHDATANSTG